MFLKKSVFLKDNINFNILTHVETSHNHQNKNCNEKQESPPAGNRKKHTTRGITCSRISYPVGTYLGRGDTYLGWEEPTLTRGYLPWTGGT